MEERDALTFWDFPFNGDVFRVPSSGYHFNNSDCWARVDGRTAKVGLSDHVRLNPVELLSFKPPVVGARFAIFDGLCSFETSGSSLEVYSPVSGVVVAVNELLLDDPGLAKEEPYGRGWVAELELTDIDDDLGLLLGCEEYFSLAKAKASGGPLLGCPCSRRPEKAPPKEA